MTNKSTLIMLACVLVLSTFGRTRPSSNLSHKLLSDRQMAEIKGKGCDAGGWIAEFFAVVACVGSAAALATPGAPGAIPSAVGACGSSATGFVICTSSGVFQPQGVATTPDCPDGQGLEPSEGDCQQSGGYVTGGGQNGRGVCCGY